METKTTATILHENCSGLATCIHNRNTEWVEVNELLNHIPVLVSTILEGYSINAQILSRQTIRELNTQIFNKFKQELGVKE